MENEVVQVIDVVHRHGGDVIKFAGDAMIIAFYPDAQEVLRLDSGYRDAVLRCAQCSLEVRLVPDVAHTAHIYGCHLAS